MNGERQYNKTKMKKTLKKWKLSWQKKKERHMEGKTERQMKWQNDRRHDNSIGMTGNDTGEEKTINEWNQYGKLDGVIQIDQKNMWRMLINW